MMPDSSVQSPVDETPKVATSAAEELVKSIASLFSAFALYPPSHPKIEKAAAKIHRGLEGFWGESSQVTIGALGHEFIVLGKGLQRLERIEGVHKVFQQAAVEKIVFSSGVTVEEIGKFFSHLSQDRAVQGDTRSAADLPAGDWPHISVGRFSGATVMEDLRNGAAPLSEEEARMVQEYLDASQELLSQVRESRMLEFNLAKEIVDNILKGIILEDNAIPLVAQLKKHDEYSFTHSLNVSTLCLAMGRYLGLSQQQLKILGIAALLHDTGKALCPLEILQKKGRLTEEEIKIIQKHPLDGARMLVTTRDVPDLAPVVAFEHHIHHDGSGYPVRYQGRQTHVCSRVTAVADVFDALRSIRAYCSEVSKVETFQKMAQMPLDPFLFNLFAWLVRLYPVGTHVQLDTGETGVIHEVHPTNAFRPRVRLLRDVEKNRQKEDRIVNLDSFDKMQNRYVRSIDAILPQEEAEKLA
jgi:HD-GYP domain-containing protein (c-di-GMP phosphodiesterase class II)